MAARAALVATLLSAGALACASQGFPPGGPVDREPPALARSEPADRAVNAAPDQAIRLVFDEVLDDRQVSRLSQLVLVNPDTPDFDYELDEERIILSPRKPLLDATTYIVTILPGLADREGNATRRARTILFSVGGETPITLSLVRATILQRDTVPAVGARYRLENLETDFAYEMVADSSGRVELEGVAFGPYRATAWIERSRPPGWQETEEPGARDSFALSAGNRSHEATYRIAVRDTTPPVVSRATASDSRVVTIETSDRLEADIVPPAAAIRVWEGPEVGATPVDSIPLERMRGRPIGVSAVERTGPSTLRVAVSEPLRKDRWYRIEVVGVPNVDGLESTAEGGLAFRPEYEGAPVVPSEPVEWPGRGPP